MAIKSDFLNNRITLTRLICSILVLVSHLDWIAGNPTDNFRRLGLFAVAIFFGLSGFLLTDSILRNGASIDFIRNRIIRIFPGFIGVLVFTSLFFAPLSHIIKVRDFDYVFTQDNIFYIFRNVTSFILQPDINQSLESSNVSNWNPPLWTLSYELLCYLFLFILVWSLKIRYTRAVSIFLPALIAIYVLVGFSFIYIPDRISMVIYYSSFFFLGSFLYLKKAHRNFTLFILLIFSFPLLFLIPGNSDKVFFDNRDFAVGIFLIPLVLFLSFNLKVPIKLSNDYSFGIYIYSAPISQLLILNFNTMRQNWLIYASCTLGVTLVFSWLSWHLIEKPALKLKKRSVSSIH